VQAWKLKATARSAAAAAGEGSDPDDAQLEQLLAGVMEGEEGEELEGFLDDYQGSDDGDDDDDNYAAADNRITHSNEDDPMGIQHGNAAGKPKHRREGKEGGKGQGVGEDGPILSFSQVDLRLPMKKLCKRFPLFPPLSTAMEVELEAGEMLYLPAGWFHEVTSYGTTGEGEGGRGGRM
jgi:hypothetical protein